jgi:hypothetical protein
MEEGGHYYTVYYTSLAVGFKDDIAHQHALLSQMADEVADMDATNLQIKQCFNYMPFGLNSEFDLEGNSRKVGASHRFTNQNAHHALQNKNSNITTKSSSYQQIQTTDLLSKENAGSLLFGLLLHRLGDTYAHSKIGNNSELYTVNNKDECFKDLMGAPDNFGHLFHYTTPDHPILRPVIFFSYLQNLHTILSNKHREISSRPYRQHTSPRSYSQVKQDFEFIHEKSIAEIKYRFKSLDISEKIADKIFIKNIRQAAEARLLVQMNKYEPEESGDLQLSEFISQHKSVFQRMFNTTEVRFIASEVRNATSKMTPADAPYIQEDLPKDSILTKFVKDNAQTIQNMGKQFLNRGR